MTMKVLKSKDIEVRKIDDFLYEQIITILQQVRLVRGGNDLAYTLRNHPIIKNYCEAKQRYMIQYIEETYFHPDGTVDFDVVENYNRPLH